MTNEAAGYRRRRQPVAAHRTVGAAAAAVCAAGIVGVLTVTSGSPPAVATSAPPAHRLAARTSDAPAPTTTVAPTTTTTPPSTTAERSATHRAHAAALTKLPAGTTAGPWPGSFVITVKSGETLSGIALWFTTHGYEAIYKANETELGPNPNYILPGEKIVVDPADDGMAVIPDKAP